MLYNDKIEKPNDNYIAFKNGLYSFKEDKLIPFSPKVFVVNKLNINYIANLPSNNLEADTYVDELMNHDEKRKKGYFQIVGYCLTSKNELQVMFAFYGPTASNGKSDAIDIITRIIKKENVSHISIEEFSEKFSNVGIADKLLNVSTEVTNKKF